MINIKIIAAYNKYFTLIQKAEALKLFLTNCCNERTVSPTSLREEDDKFIKIVRQIEDGRMDFYDFLDTLYCCSTKFAGLDTATTYCVRLSVKEAAQFWLKILQKNLPEEVQTSLNPELLATSAYFSLNAERLIKEVKDSFVLSFIDEDIAFSEPVQSWTREGRHTKDPRYMMSRKGRRR